MTLKAEFARLDIEHWDGIIALAAKAENAEDLNDIINELEAVKRCRLDIIDVCEAIEKAVTQWENITADIIDIDEWNLPEDLLIHGACVTSATLDKVFKKDDNTIIIWDDLKPGYTECKRRDPIAED